MSDLALLLSLLFLFASAGCATETRVSAERLRALQVRTFAGSDYTVVFRSFMQTLAQQGYAVYLHDDSTGVIAGSRPGRSEEMQVFVNIDREGPLRIAARATIQRVGRYQLEEQGGEEILDIRPYAALFRNVNLLVARTKVKQLP